MEKRTQPVPNENSEFSLATGRRLDCGKNQVVGSIYSEWKKQERKWWVNCVDVDLGRTGEISGSRSNNLKNYYSLYKEYDDMCDENQVVTGLTKYYDKDRRRRGGSWSSRRREPDTRLAAICSTVSGYGGARQVEGAKKHIDYPQYGSW